MKDNQGVIHAGAEPPSLTSGLFSLLSARIAEAGGWIGFERCMQLMLYQPGLGYYASGSRKFGAMPDSGSDFVTAPEMSPLFGHCLAAQLRQALDRTGTDEIWEFGAGTGALARQLLEVLGERVRRYHIVELSASLQARQRAHLAGHAGKLAWEPRLPTRLQGVVVGNEVLDAMPVRLLARLGGAWFERGVTLRDGALAWADRPTHLRPPVDIPGGHDYLTEIHPQAEAFVRTLGETLERGAAFFIDYGFPETEYYHPQRSGGTLMCHQGHRADPDPLVNLGLKDISAHVNFSGIALAAQSSGLACLGYTSQGRFLINCGLGQALDASTLAQRALAQRLVNEHEMGELFKVIGFAPPAPGGGGLPDWDALGFADGDRTHTL